jgi:steroid 5-alpha reductase family enzyme
MMLSLAVLCLLVLLVVLSLVWWVSIKLHDASIVDICWGLTFVLSAWVGLGWGDGAHLRSWLIVGLVSIWGIRLSLYLARRNLGKGEDFRYQEMRRRFGRRFPLLSLFIVFWFQGVISWLVSMPILASLSSPLPIQLTSWDYIGASLWVLGFLFEAIGDRQLASFKADPRNQGKVMDRGLWRYTRHPNYFGNALLWWGLGLFGVSVGASWTLFGPALMTFFLVRVSGVALLERTITQRRPEYADYIQRTSAFFPWFPKRNS